MRSPRLWVALAAFALVGISAAATLEGKYRQAVLILVFGLAARLVISYLAAQAAPPPPTSESPK